MCGKVQASIFPLAQLARRPEYSYIILIIDTLTDGLLCFIMIAVRCQ